MHCDVFRPSGTRLGNGLDGRLVCALEHVKLTWFLYCYRQTRAMSQDATSVATACERQVGRSGATTGPSPEEWLAHKDTIIELYNRMPWSQLNEIMKNEHGFHAR